MKDKRLFDYCPWCDEPVINGEPSVVISGEKYHLSCAAEEEDNVFFDRDMEFGDR